MANRRTERMAQDAAQQASEAGRILQAQRQQGGGESPSTVEPIAPERTDDAAREAPKPRNDPREKAFAEIEARADRTRAEEIATPGIGTAEEQAAAAVKEAQAPAAEATPAIEATPTTDTAAAVAAPVQEAPTIKTVRVKVDGEEFDVAESEVEEAGGIKPYQMLKAADKRLKTANETVANAKQMQDSIAQWIKQQSQPAPAQKVSSEELIESRLDAIRYGTPQEGRAAFQEILQHLSPAVDQNAIVAQAIDVMSNKAAINKFKDEFADLVANPMLLRLASALESDRLASIKIAHGQRQPVDWDDFYRRIGNEVRSVSPRPNQTAATTAPTTASTTSPVSSESKEDRKASIVNLPTAAARAKLPEETKPQTRKDIIQEMKTSRGLPTG